MSPERLRAYVVILTADVLPAFLACFIPVYGLVTRQFQYWMLPLIAGLAGVPLVRPRASGYPEVEERPE